MQNIEKNSVEYKQAISIMDKVRAEFRQQCPNIACYRNFSESRANGRRLKFWGIRQTVFLVEHDLIMAASRMIDTYYAGLRMAGWHLEFDVFRSGGYKTLNVTFHLTKLTK